MPQQRLTHDNIGELDNGNAGAIINKVLDAAVSDLDDRGGDDGKARKVVITLELWRLQEGVIAADVQAKWSGPAYATNPTQAKLRQQGKGVVGAMFQVQSPENADQEPLFEDRPAHAAV